MTEPSTADGIESRAPRVDIPPDPPRSAQPPVPPAAAVSLGLTPPHAAAVAWAGGWFTGLIVLWLRPPDRFVRVHATQAALALGGLMALAIGSWGLGVLMAFVSPSLFRTLTWLSTATWVLMTLVWIAGLVQAWRGRSLRLPVVSSWADRITSRRSTLPAPQHPL